MGHGRSRGLRQIATAVVPGHGRDTDVFLGRQPGLSREHTGEVDARSETLLSQRAHHPRRQQERFEKRSGDHQRAEQNETGAGQAAGGQSHGREDKRVCLPGVFGQEQGGRQGSFRDGHESRPASQKEEEGSLHPSVNRYASPYRDAAPAGFVQQSIHVLLEAHNVSIVTKYFARYQQENYTGQQRALDSFKFEIVAEPQRLQVSGTC